MTNEEILSKDFQIFTFKTLMINSALLRTILENQSEIMRQLNIEKSNKEINELYNKHLEQVDELSKKYFPEFKDVNPPLKD